jgi:ankyrin repeat protein
MDNVSNSTNGLTQEAHSAAIYVAQFYGNRELEALLWQYKDDKNAVISGNGDTVLHVAARNNYESIVRLFIESGADLHIRNIQGDFPLSTAIKSGSVGAADLLLKQETIHMVRGLNPRAGQTNAERLIELFRLGVDSLLIHDMTLLSFAAYNPNADINHINFLLSLGANVNARSHTGYTPLLLCAASGGNPAVASALIEAGASIFDVSNENESVWTLLINNEFSGMLDIINCKADRLISSLTSMRTLPPSLTTPSL